MSPLEAQESRKTFKNSVNALGWGVMDAATVDQQAQIVYGDIMFDDCKLTIVAPLRNEESPEAILGTTLDAPDHLPLELGGYLELRTRLNNEPDLVTKLGWQDCWLEPAG
jgi:hypothetical protein